MILIYISCHVPGQVAGCLEGTISFPSLRKLHLQLEKKKALITHTQIANMHINMNAHEHTYIFPHNGSLRPAHKCLPRGLVRFDEESGHGELEGGRRLRSEVASRCGRLGRSLQLFY